MFFKISISTKSIVLLTFLAMVVACGSPSSKARNDQSKRATEQTPGSNSKAKKSHSPQEESGENQAPLTKTSVRTFYTKYAAQNSNNQIIIETDFGSITIRLYQNTPLHRANMLYLTEQDYFNGTWFHRVSKGHVIQAGNNDEPATVEKRKALGEYTIPAEALDKNYHKKGAVAAARSYSNNPQKRSDPFEFYIVLGSTFTSGQLKAMADKEGISFSPQQTEIYTTVGGAPHLDGEHTVFGEVLEGMDVVEAISKVEVDSGEWPLKNVPIRVRIP